MAYSTTMDFALERQHIDPYDDVKEFMVSNPPIFSLAPVLASLNIFTEAGMENLRAKSILLTGHLEFLVNHLMGNDIKIITPNHPDERGAQLSLYVEGKAEALQRALNDEGVVCDSRGPHILRLAPAPLYNTFEYNCRAVDALKRIIRAT